jgi:predicted GTPase
MFTGREHLKIISQIKLKAFDIGTLLPAMGYGEAQLRDMETTINNTDCDAVVIATPIDIKLKKNSGCT